MPNISEPITACLKCGGPLWDNRGTKKNAKQPDFKCKATGCDTAYWLDTKGRAAYPAAPSAPPASTTYQTPVPGAYTWEDVERAYARAYKIASKIHAGQSDDVLQKATVTIFIFATGKQMKVITPRLEERPPALDERDDDLPY